MPYYIFQVRPPGLLDKLGEHASFREASTQAKALRAALPEGSAARVKVMFGENQLAAEDQLLQVRAPGPAGEE